MMRRFARAAAGLSILHALELGAQGDIRTSRAPWPTTPAGASVVVLDTTDIRASGARTLVELLAGRVAGLSVTFQSGISNTAPRIHVRGTAGMHGTPEPQLYVDGTLIREERLPTGEYVADEVPLLGWQLPADEIERVEVILGAAGAALLEFGASRGAVLVTTKQPVAGGPRFEIFSAAMAADAATAPPDFYGTVSPEYATDASGCTVSRRALGTCTATSMVRWSPLRDANPFAKRVGRRGAIRAMGTIGSTGYRLEGSVQQSGDGFGGVGLQRGGLAATLRRDVGRGLTLTTQARWAHVSGDRPPWWEYYVENRRLVAANFGAVSPDSQMQTTFIDGRKRVHRADQLLLSVATDWAVTPALRASLRAGMDLDRRFTDSFSPFGNSRVKQGGTGRSLRATVEHSHQVAPGIAGVALVSASVEREQHQDSTGDYEDRSRVERTSLIIREEFSSGRHRSFGASVRMQSVEGLMWLSTPGALPQVDANWVISEESFFPRSRVLSHLRLRAAYGESYDAEWLPELLSIVVPAFPPPTLWPDRAERTREREVGVNVRFLADLVTLDLTYFSRHTRNAIIEYPIPSASGFATTFANRASWSAEGVDLRLGIADLPLGPVRWSNLVSATFLRDQKAVVPLLPFFQLSEQFQQFYVQSGLPLGTQYQSGFTYNDANSDGLIDATEITPVAAYSNLGSTEPDQLLGWTSTLRIGSRLALGLQVDGQRGHVRVNRTEVFSCMSYVCRGLHDPEAPLAEQARAVARRHTSVQSGFVEDASFVKLREVWMRLLLPRFLTPTHEASLVLSGRNLMLWTPYSGGDPELNYFIGPSFRVPSIDPQPHLRSVAMRLELVW